MNKTCLIAFAVALAVAPLAYGHSPDGTPKAFCEGSGDLLLHEYGPPATGVLLAFFIDGANRTGTAADCGLPNGGDGHAEYALGGAWILVNTGLGVPSADPTVGAGALYCFGAEGHHGNFVTVNALDASPLGAGVEVTVAADTVDLTGVGEGCGDFESDESATGFGTVTANFPHGLDGTYQVYVTGTQGHISTN